MLYGSKIWAETLDLEKRENSLVSIQRTAAFHIATVYRIVCDPAVLVIASTTPVDLLTAELMGIYKAKLTVTLGKTPFQYGNHDGMVKIEEGRRQSLFQT